MPFYDFAPKFVGGTNWIWSKLPEPSAAFVIGAPPDADEWLSRGCKENSFAWQGNPETQPGDVILLYQWTPTSAFTSIWQATAPGFIDPLFGIIGASTLADPCMFNRLHFVN